MNKRKECLLTRIHYCKFIHTLQSCLKYIDVNKELRRASYLIYRFISSACVKRQQMITSRMMAPSTFEKFILHSNLVKDCE